MKKNMLPIDRLILRATKEDRGYSSECWIFNGALNAKGYGRFRVDGVLVLPHRYAYEQLVGSISAGDELDHLCRVHACCNPEHMEPVTGPENRRRGLKGVLLPKSCREGHVFSVANTIRRNSGRRDCRECNRARNAARHLAKTRMN